MSYYTRYRPQTIGDLDLTSVKTSLGRILTSGTFSQAYLFSGPKGTGKTSSARILAKLVNCEQNRPAVKAWMAKKSGKKAEAQKLVEPCNQCDSCRRITSGSSLACVEMDGASNRGIDDVRSLRERMGLAPAEGMMTVYIIDEVHMLTTEAFNALLKTLEEPPKHALFVLCTTETHKVPGTVVSRCTQVPFVKASPAEVVGSLKKAIEGEKLSIEAAAVERLAALVDGSFRDGMKSLEQLAQLGRPIEVADVDAALGFGGLYESDELIERLLSDQMSQSLELMSQRLEAGADAEVWMKRIIDRLRTGMLERMNRETEDGQLWWELTRVFEAAFRSVKQSPLPGLVLELAVGEWCYRNAEQAAVFSQSPAAPKHQAQPTKTEHSPPRVQKIQAADKQATQPKQDVPDVPTEAKTTKKPLAQPVEPPKKAFAGDVAVVVEKWNAILEAVRPLNHSLEALLRSAQPVALNDGCLVMEAFYLFHKEQLEQQRHRDQLEAVIGQVLGGSIRLEIQLAKRGQKKVTASQVEAVVNVTGSVEDEALVAAAEEIFG
jgi:DNA polymerase III subunit gamma/tau